jgi:hypothetical protein
VSHLRFEIPINHRPRGQVERGVRDHQHPDPACDREAKLQPAVAPPYDAKATETRTRGTTKKRTRDPRSDPTIYWTARDEESRSINPCVGAYVIVIMIAASNQNLTIL